MLARCVADEPSEIIRYSYTQMTNNRHFLPSTVSLLCFEAAARHESFSQAARELNLTQGAISRQIRLLEENLDQKLFERVRQRVVLSQGGRIYLEEVNNILQLLETSTIRLKSLQKLSGNLNIGCYPTLASRWFLPFLLEYTNQTTDIKLSSITYRDNSHFDNEIVDIGVVQGDAPFEGYRADWLMPEELIVVASPNLIAKPLKKVTDILSHRLISHVTRPQSWQIWLDSQQLSGIETPVGLSLPQFEMVIEATVSGYGVSILPSVLVQNELQNGSLIRAHEHSAQTQSAYYLLTPNHKVEAPRINAFRAWMLNGMKRRTDLVL